MFYRRQEFTFIIQPQKEHCKKNSNYVRMTLLYRERRISMANLLEGKCAVVTGGGRGMGRETCLQFAKYGARVVVNDLGGSTIGEGADRSPAEEVADEIKQMGGQAVASYDNVADFAAAKNIIDTCVDNFGKIDILVNCAGIGDKLGVEFWDTSKETWDLVIGVNLTGTFNTMCHALGHMVKQKWGRIINFSSPSWMGCGGANAYGASKSGVSGLTTGLSTTLALKGFTNITCNAIVPIAKTRMNLPEGKLLWESLHKIGQITEQIYVESCDPPGPEHAPPMIVYLASEQGANITGQMIGTSRGRVALYSWPTEVKGLYKEGIWTPEELVKLVPRTFGQDLRTAKG
jgi:NAD(P)-dependent dehydrogenase (short-subunit alcohol dehydrogenase family)